MTLGVDLDTVRKTAANAHLQALQFGYDASSTTRESFDLQEHERLRNKYPQMFPQVRKDGHGSSPGTLIDLRPDDPYAPRRNVHEVRIRDMKEQERREQSIMAALTVVGLSMVIWILHLRTRR